MDADGESRAGTAAEAFELLANDLRMSILEALYEAGESVPFSDLYDAVDANDSGQFNYHLGKLTDRYVRREGAGYRLTRSGRRLLSAVFAGDILEGPAIDPTPVDRACPRCDSTVELRYEDETLRVLCTECPGFFEGEVDSDRVGRENPAGTISVLPLPASGVEGRTPDAILDASATWLVRRHEFFAAGMCPTCAGEVESSVVVCRDHDADDGLCEACGRAIGALVSLECPTCGDGLVGALQLTAIGHSAVRSFFADHGRDLLAPDYETALALVAADGTVDPREPPAVDFTWTFEGESLRVRIDDEPAVIEAERE